MNQQIGIIKEVFIPVNEPLNNSINNLVGFKVETNNGEIVIIEEQNELNSKIFKGDTVIINKQNISGKEFIDIELYDGDKYE